MSNLMRMPHEISLWDDILTVVDDAGNEYEGFVSSTEVTVVAQYYKEKKLCVISSDKLESPAYVVDPQLVRKTDGTNTLTFSIYAKIYDEETGEFIDNPFVQYLTNERKVKLKYYPNGKMKWLDFIIKKIDENSENYKFTYTATDLFINELSKSGYGLEYNIELENSQGTIDKLARDVLNGTDWAVGADSEKLQQTVTEALYAVALTDQLNAKDIFTEDEKIISKGETIYVYYSVIANKTYDYFQFIYSEDGNYAKDENGIVYNSGNYYAELKENDLPYDDPVYFNDFRAERYVRSPKTIYDEVIGKYVNVYKRETEAGTETVYGYSESEYISPALVNNFITNGAHIISNSGWLQQKAGSIKVEMLPTYKETTYYEPGRLHCIEFEKSDTNTYLLNTGLSDNASKIGSITKGDSFVFRIKGGAPTTKDNITTGTSAVNISFNVEIATYKFDDNGLIEKDETLAYGTTSAKNEWCYIDDLKFSRAISVEELTDLTIKRFGIFISVNGANGTYYIHEAEFFRCIKDQGGYIILPNGQTMLNGVVFNTAPTSYVDTTYYYYTPNDEATDISEIKYLYIGKRALNTYRPDYVADFEKIRSINAKETNRFNLLQTLSETFECWCRFNVLHKANGEIALARDVAQEAIDASADGKVQKIYVGYGPADSEEEQINANLIKTVEDGYRQQKFVTFHKRIGQEKPIGFTYGINLKSISRSLDSNDIATKLIVKSNNNQYANMGSCNIARANMNPSGENFVLDFSHYIRQGLLNYENVQRDLYLKDDGQGWLGLLTKLKDNNIERDKLITEQSSLIKEYSKFKSEDESSKLLLAGAQEELLTQRNYYCDLTGFEHGDIEKKISKLEAQLLEPPEGETEKTLEEKIESLKGWLENTKVIATATSIERLIEEIKQHKENRDAAEAQLLSIKNRLDKLEQELDKLKDDNHAELDKFEQKYSRFLQEASWISEDYTDDNLYYIDAESTLHKSAQPKVSYAINIVELSALEGYEAYNFDLGDITYVQDPDFFGWETKDGVKTPYKEEVVITESATYFNSPEKNTLKAQNYRSSFEDLFQRLTASSQQLQFYGGSYDRAADVVDTNGNIMPKSLSEAFANNAYVLSNIANQSVKWDEYGITTTDTTDPTDIVRITSGGIYLTEDGGRNWTTGISASGINAKTITTGQLDTGAVTIMSGDQTAFRWDETGINAFKENENGERSSKTYVRFDEHGLYGIDGQANFDPKDGLGGNSPIERIEDEAKFALTWDGFVLNSGKGDPTSRIKISDKEDFQLYRTVTNFVTDSEGNFVTDSDGNPITKTEEQEAVRIGRLGNNNSVGMQVNVSKTDATRPVIIGDTGLVDGEHGKLVFRAGGGLGETDDNAPFRVYEDGFFYAKNAQIGGTLTAAQLRDISISLSYSGEVDGNSVLLTCSPTIAKDELDRIVWKIDDVSIASEATIRLDYDRIKEIYEGKEIPKTIKLTVIAQVSGDGDADDSNGDSRDGEIDVDITSIFKTETAYAIGDSGTEPPKDGWNTKLPSFEAGKYCWMRVSNIFVIGEPQIRYEVTYFGKDGADVRDLNLKASSYVFIQDKEGKVSEDQKINFTAEAHNIFGGKFKWFGVDNEEDQIDNTASLSYAPDLFAEKQGHVVTVQYVDPNDETNILFEDSTTIALVKDGSDAISISLTNPTMTFVKDINTTELTGAIVYYGSNQIEYATTGNTGWRYTITCQGATITEKGIIEISNPGETMSYSAIITVYKDGGIYRTWTLTINCLVTESPYTIELSNDSATIGVDEKGSYDSESLKLVTQTNVTVHKGTTDITEECDFAWAAEGGTLSSNSGTSNFFTGLSVGSTTAMTTVVVTLKDSGLMIGTKTLKVAKIEAGAAVSYKLNVVPNSFNKTQNSSQTVTITAHKIVGADSNQMNEGYKILVNGTDMGTLDKVSISDTTTFGLKIGDTVWDSETVVAVSDGQNGQAIYSIDLSNDSAVIVTDKDGNNGGYGDNAKTTATVYYGGSVDTGWTYSVSPASSTNLTYKLSNNNQTISITGMTTDSGELTFTATKTGCPTLTKVFKISKLKKGESGSNGKDAVSYWLTSSLSAIGMDQYGNYKDTTLTFTAKAQVGMNQPGSYNTKLCAYIDGGTEPYQTSNNGTLSVTLNQVEPTKSIRCVMYYGNTSTILDEEKILVVKDGANGTGTDGTDGDTIAHVYAYTRVSKPATGTIPTTPTKPTGTPSSSWSFNDIDGTSSQPYVYRTQGTKTVSTKSGSEETSYSNWSTPELYKAYNGVNSDIPQNNYAEYLKLTNFETQDALVYATDENDKSHLYINASHINTGSLTVKDSSNEPIFSAGFSGISNQGNVQIGAFDINNSGFYYTDMVSAEEFYIKVDGTFYKYTVYLKNWSLTPFGVFYSIGIFKAEVSNADFATEFSSEQEAKVAYGVSSFGTGIPMPTSKAFVQKKINWGRLAKLLNAT